ncbi:MAG: hypothetical protein ACI4DV_03060 [Lachnospiraceae bacterium]
MRTPIADFVREYEQNRTSRFHMPGHKGEKFLGCEAYDITEVTGADALYEAQGIIAESERNASELFGSARTVFSTEGSSQCIRAMMYLAVNCQRRAERPYVIAARNVHKAFLYAAALLDFDVVWLWPEKMHSLCSCRISEEQLEKELKKYQTPPAAVYVTSPDYLGGRANISALAEICHRYHTILAVDNAHGSYLHFLEKGVHPLDLGADICCDSAHKTLPVLTGGAYLQIGKGAPEYFVKNAKQAMALFGSTSPSYLTLMSLDLCNAYLAGEYRDKLEELTERMVQIRSILRNRGWKVEVTDPLKLTVCAPEGLTGFDIAEHLRIQQIECEYADRQYIVLMMTPENTENDFERLLRAFPQNERVYRSFRELEPIKSIQQCSIREAVFSEHEKIRIEDAVGRVCGAPTVGCPPAIPIAVSGEVIDEKAGVLFEYYGITEVDVIKQ